MITTRVVCDGCGTDLTYTWNSIDYRLVLANERMPTDPGATTVTDMGIPTPIERAAHFCGVGCLHHWLEHSVEHHNFLQKRG